MIMRYIKQNLAAVLAVLFALPALAQDFQYEGIWYTVIDPDAKTCKTKEGEFASAGNTFEGDLIIPSKVNDGSEEYSVVSIGYRSFYYCKGITSVTLPETLTTIENSAFIGCSGITSLSLSPNLISIGESAFGQCKGLTTVEFPPSLTTIEYGAFNQCEAITSAILPESLTSLGSSAFGSCMGIKNIYIPASLASLANWTFTHSNEVTSITYAASVPYEMIENNFHENAYESAILYAPNASIADIQATPYWNKFKHIEAKDGSVTPPLAAGEHFQYEGIWYTVIDPDAKTCKTKEGSDEAVNYGGGNTVVGDLVIPEKVSDGANEYTVVEIGSHGFFYSQELTSVTIPNSVTKISFGAFGMCTGLTSVTLSQSLTTIEYTAFGECRSLESIKLPEGVTSIGNWAFDGCNHLRDVILPGSLTEIGELVFRGCVLLKSIEYDAVTPLTTSDIFVEETYSEATLKMPNATLASVQAAEPWNKFLHIVAKDGSVTPPLAAGDDFQYEGIWYTVIDAENKTCRTKEGKYISNGDGTGDYISGNVCSGDIVIPAVVSCDTDTYSVTEIGTLSFHDCEELISVNIPETVTSIGMGAFDFCLGLKTINIPDGVESIGAIAFQTCSSLTSIILPSNISIVNEYTFSGCSSLTNINIPEGIKSIITGAFNMCTGLTTVTIPGTIESIWESAFTYCYNLTSVNYRGVSPVSAPERIFDDDTYLKATLSMPNAALADVQATVPWNKFKHIVAKDGTMKPSLVAGDDFQYEGIWYTVLDADAKTCKTKGAGVNEEGLIVAVNACEGDLVIPSVVSDGTSNYTVVEIGDYGFYQCSGLTSVAFPESLTTIGWGAFEGCTGLTEIIFPSSLKVIGVEAFKGCSGLTTIDLPAYLSSIQNSAFEGCTGLTSIVIPESVIEIGEGAFSDCSKMSSVILPSGLTSIEGAVFQNCSSLTSINLPQGLTSIGDFAFSECNALQFIVIPEGVTTIGAVVFNNCYALNSAIIPESVTAIGFSAFQNCSRLETVNIPKSITSIEGLTFMNCISLKSIELPDNLVFIGDGVFEGCSSLSEISLPQSLNHIGQRAFGDCSNLKQIDYNAENPIPASDNVFDANTYETATLNTPSATLADIQATVPWNKFGKIAAKDGSVGLTVSGEDFEYDGIVYTVLDSDARTCRTKDASADFPGNIAEGKLVLPDVVPYNGYDYWVVGIGTRSFNSCPNLLSVIIPGTVEDFGSEAFAGCERLTSILWKGSTEIPETFISEIGNPNLMIYTAAYGTVPASVDRNVVGPDGVCTDFVLTPGYPFTPLRAFTAIRSRMTKEFTQTTPIDGCSGWESLVLPFDVKTIVTDDGRTLTPFASLSDIDRQYPFWLCEANPDGLWRDTDAILAGVPYVLSMPNNAAYDERYRIDGPVTFLGNDSITITPAVTEPYAVGWQSGREFRPLWLPLSDEEASQAMGLNAGISGLYADDGEELLPGSAFHADVTPRPLEAYVTRLDSSRALRIGGGQTMVRPLPVVGSLDVRGGVSSITLRSVDDRRVTIHTPEGMLLRTVDLKGGETRVVDDLTRGIYIVAGRKIIVK